MPLVQVPQVQWYNAPPPGAEPAPPPPFVPSDIAGLQVWLKEDGLAGVDGDPIGTWTDSSGTGHNFTQATGAQKPIKKTGILNGRAVARFDGADDTLEGGDLSALFGTAATLFIVAIPAVTQYGLYQTSVGNGYWRWSGDGNGYMRVFRTTRLEAYPTAMPSSGSHYFAIRSSASAYEMWKDGVSSGSQAANHNAGDLHRLGIGDNGGGGLVTGDVAELIIYDSALSAGDIASVHGYIAARFGL